MPNQIRILPHVLQMLENKFLLLFTAVPVYIDLSFSYYKEIFPEKNYLVFLALHFVKMKKNPDPAK
jgi:hypothetical protein